jgi:hypothetical protein
MYSAGLAALRSSASAGRPKSAFHSVVVMNCSRARMRVGRAVAAVGRDEEVVVLRVARRSRSRRPSG